MSARRNNPGWTTAALALALLAGTRLPAQPPVTGAAQKGADGTLVDQVVAVVNGEPILESDIDEERRAAAFQPLHDAEDNSRSAIVKRLIDRELILQQSKLQPDDRVTLDQARARLQEIARDIPACKQYHCETAAGWQKYVQAQGFTVAAVEERERQEMEILKYIELRFRSGIQIKPQQIKDYYDHTLVPKELKLQMTPPPLENVSDQIQAILLEQQVNDLLEDWLTSLKAQGSVHMMQPSEEVP